MLFTPAAIQPEPWSSRSVCWRKQKQQKKKEKRKKKKNWKITMKRAKCTKISAVY